MTIADYVFMAELQDLKYLGHDSSNWPVVMQYEKDILIASKGFAAIHKPDGEFLTKIVPGMQGICKVDEL